MQDIRQGPLLFGAILGRMAQRHQAHQMHADRSAQHLANRLAIGLLVPRHPTRPQSVGPRGHQQVLGSGAAILQVVFGVPAEDRDAGGGRGDELAVIGGGGALKTSPA